MILIKETNTLTGASVYISDNEPDPQFMRIVNRQSGEEVIIQPYYVRNSRSFDFTFWVPDPVNPEPIPLVAQYIGVTILPLQKGQYTYEFGSHRGLIQVGLPIQENTKTYNKEENNKIYYGGE